MKLREFPLLTDENVDPDVVAGLRRLGFDAPDVTLPFVLVARRSGNHVTIRIRALGR